MQSYFTRGRKITLKEMLKCATSSTGGWIADTERWKQSNIASRLPRHSPDHHWSGLIKSAATSGGIYSLV